MFEKLLNRLPFIAAITIAVLWGAVYLFFGELSGMWKMFDRNFPFFIAWIIRIHPGNMSVWEGILFASVDGGLFGWFVGALLRLLFSEK